MIRMKAKTLILAALLLSGGGAAAQQTAPVETTPPLYQGAPPQRFIVQLVNEAEGIVLAEEVKAAELTPVVYVRTVIDTTGRPSV